MHLHHRKPPDVNVVVWIKQRPGQSLYLSVLTLGEIRKGIERLDDTQGTARRTLLIDWLEQKLPTYFLGRMLPIDAQVADRWGRFNVKDFAGLNLDIINPWDV